LAARCFTRHHVEPLGELLFERREQVPIRVERDLDRGMPKPFLNRLRVRACIDREGCSRMPKVVLPERGEAGALDGWRKHAPSEVVPAGGFFVPTAEALSFEVGRRSSSSGRITKRAAPARRPIVVLPQADVGPRRALP
jgi:hypothetical protein